MPVVEIENLRYRYGDRVALDGLSFSVEEGEMFALLGPNGSGKTTLFRLLSTLYTPVEGTIRIFGADLAGDPASVRKRIGVVFQNPSLDPKLTVEENLIHQGRLYGLSGAKLRTRIGEMLERLHIRDRAGDRVETLSGGLSRRVELARGLLHQPGLLILDEPSVGLDPGARHDLWAYLAELRTREGVTLLVTTHLVEEADRATRVLVLNEGRIVALDTPRALKDQIGGDVVTLTSRDPETLSAGIRTRFSLAPAVMDGTVRLERTNGAEFVAEVFGAFPGMIDSVTLARPTLEDVFIARTGHTLWENGE
jgi:ABC-2 type transport system ATP-binding protein